MVLSLIQGAGFIRWHRRSWPDQRNHWNKKGWSIHDQPFLCCQGSGV